jgi:RNA polymerase sigma-70 factor (ECF subfamily)
MSKIEYTLLDDSALLHRYRSTDDSGCVGMLFRRYRHLVFGVCLKYLKNTLDAEDATMEIFEKLHQDLKTIEVSYFKTWLYTVSRNHCLMRLRKAGLVVEYPENLPEVGSNTVRQEEVIDEAEERFLKEMQYDQLEIHLANLKPEQRDCLTRFYLQDKSYKQIMVETGMSLNEIKSHIQNGKLNLKKIWMRQK